MEFVRSIVWMRAPWRVSVAMTGCASSMPMYLSSIIFCTTAPFSGDGAMTPSSPANSVGSACCPASAAETTRRNESPSSLSTMPWRFSTSRIASRYCSSVSSRSGVVRSVIVVCGTLGALSTVRPVRSAYSMMTRSADASWKLRAFGESSYGMTGIEPLPSGCVTALVCAPAFALAAGAGRETPGAPPRPGIDGRLIGAGAGACGRDWPNAAAASAKAAARAAVKRDFMAESPGSRHPPAPVRTKSAARPPFRRHRRACKRRKA